jgi:hypothetical protein
MIDFASEKVITLTHATRILPQRREGKRPNIATLYRWSIRGVKGVVLETIQIGGSRCTSIEALQRFFERLSQQSQGLPLAPAPMSPSARIRNERARRELIAKGVKCGEPEPRPPSAVSHPVNRRPPIKAADLVSPPPNGL